MKRIEKLTAEHLAIYLAYGMEMVCHANYKGGLNTIQKLLGIGEMYVTYRNTCYQCVDVDLMFIKPILRTLKSITKEELQTFSICFRMWYDKPSFDYNLIVYSDIIQMAKLHIDIFGLIESGLAVEKETIKK